MSSLHIPEQYLRLKIIDGHVLINGTLYDGEGNLVVEFEDMMNNSHLLSQEFGEKVWKAMMEQYGKWKGSDDYNLHPICYLPDIDDKPTRKLWQIERAISSLTEEMSQIITELERGQADTH